MRRTRHYFVYILTNPPHTSLYIGVTSDLARRTYQHRTRAMGGFAPPEADYNLQYLVYFEETIDVHSALAREKQLKGRRRSKKERLINSLNPRWREPGADVPGALDSSTPTRSESGLRSE